VGGELDKDGGGKHHDLDGVGQTGGDARGNFSLSCGTFAIPRKNQVAAPVDLPSTSEIS
jgi:hypothetical protein